MFPRWAAGVAITALAAIPFVAGIAFLGEAVTPQSGGGEALADPDGYVILAMICLVIASPLVFLAHHTFRSSLDYSSTRFERLSAAVGSGALLFVFAYVLVFGVMVTFGYGEMVETTSPEWVHPFVSAVLLLIAGSGLFVTGGILVRLLRGGDR